MKWIICSFAAALAFAAHGEEVLKLSNLSFRVKETGTKREDKDNWRSDYGSYDTTTTRQKTVLVEVQKFGSAPAPGAKIWVLWIARGASGATFIYDRSIEERDIQDRLMPVSFTSPEASERNENYMALGERYVSGMKAIGYIVGIDYGDGTVKPYFSSGLSSISSPDKLKALIAEYEVSRKSK